MGQTLQIEDLGSSNGTFLHGEQLEPGRRVNISPGEFFEVGAVVCVVRGRASHERLRQLRSHDYFLARLQDEVARTRHTRAALTIVRVQLEDDGDEAVTALLDAVRAGDVVARYAPHEYELLLVEAGDEVAESVRVGIGRALAQQGQSPSFGSARYPRDGASAEAILAAACEALEPAAGVPAGDLVIEDAAMRRLHELLVRVASGGVNVLLLGETGVGKEIFARRLHELSPRAEAPLVKLNCAAFPDNLIESELFGHERGAFTGADRRKIGLLEAASGGIAFLDELGELPLGAQAKLLRVIEDGTLRRVGGVDDIAVDVVFVGATNRDLEVEIAAGRFRADLYYRLEGFALTIPPLRERRAEIVPLATRFAAAAARRMGLPRTPAFSDEARELLDSYGWPGNIRELRNAIDRAVLLAGDAPITTEHLPADSMRLSAPGPLQRALAGAVDAAGAAPPGLTETELAERQRIIDALAAALGNQTRAAEALGISRRWLLTKMARYAIPRPRKR